MAADAVADAVAVALVYVIKPRARIYLSRSQAISVHGVVGFRSVSLSLSLSPVFCLSVCATGLATGGGGGGGTRKHCAPRELK